MLRTADTPVLPVDPRILRFIGRHRVLTLAAADRAGGGLWCCNLFYAYMPASADFPDYAGGMFVFTSPETTRHAAMFTDNPNAAGSVVLESKTVGRLQGLQFQGIVRRADISSAMLAAARQAYLKRFPFAAVMLSDLWVIEVTRFKYTDNTLGFGTKLHWPSANSAAAAADREPTRA
ncbi:hypothetical protein [uncultured Rikenella sp.]|uniref:hypothetical protein n=1 Tax=uncultured Rikenella sp. TaxID=368003 RepID=UPI002613F5BA|nr:hypothetical protein [uncultured Rikenella sp.]